MLKIVCCLLSADIKLSTEDQHVVSCVHSTCCLLVQKILPITGLLCVVLWHLIDVWMLLVVVVLASPLVTAFLISAVT